MKILFIAVFSDTSTNNSQATAFEKLGNQVIKYNYRGRAKEIGSINRDSEIIELCKNTRPDLVLFSKCNGVHSRVINECNKYSQTALWFMDFISMSWDAELEEKIKQCTFSCFAIRKSYQRAITINTNSHFIHEGFDEFTNYPIETDNKYNVSFIGNLRSERIPFYRSYDFHISNDAYGTKHNEVVASSYINLNFTSGEGTSDRTYKVLAANGFLLTQPWEDMDLDFDKTLDFDVFNTPEEMKEKIYYYLKNKDQRTKTANHGYKTVQKYTRTNWAKGIIELYERYR